MTATAAAKQKYSAHKQRVAASQGRMVAAGQDIGDLPPVRRPAVRQAAAGSLKLFLETYHRGTFTLDWSIDHLTLIARLEETITLGGFEVVVMPRGSGKSAITRGAVEWAILTGRRRFVVLVAANGNKARDEFEKIRTDFETNEDLVADWPEALYPIVALGRITQRQRGQTYQGAHTRITWLATKIVLPRIAGSLCSGSIITCAGLQTGSIRGQSHKTPEGELLRPDCALMDDVQTDESAQSDLQCDNREKLILGGVKGMAGPKKKMAALCTATVIRKNDVADRLLDRKRHPQIRGERMQALKTWPQRMDLWERYADLRRNAGDQGKSATNFYGSNRPAMDEGAEAAWPARFEPDEISAVQRCLNWWIDAPVSFWAEGQGDPQDPNAAAEIPTLAPISERTNRLPRGVVPSWAVRLVAFVDVQDKLLFYSVLALKDDFTAALIDYGSEPDQQRDYFALRDVRNGLDKSLAAAGREGGTEAAVAHGLETLTARLIQRPWKREGTAAETTELRIEKVLIDSGDNTDTVYEFCRRSPYAALIMPSKGIGIKAGDTPMTEWPARDNEKKGFHYVVTSDQEKRVVRLLKYDTNFWKTFLAKRIKSLANGSLTIFGTRAADHQMLADHCASETPTETTGKGRTVWQWKKKPNSENHYLDCLVGCYAAAALQGVQLPEMRTEPAARKKRSVRYL